MAIPNKPRKCRICKQDFQPVRIMQNVCSVECAQAKAKVDRAKAERVAALESRKVIRLKREQLKTRSDYMKEAQRAFNAFIRERDKDQPCICCGLPLGPVAVGGGYDCGHYRSVGSAPHLRFNEQNAHGQRKQCNRYGSGRAVDYRIGLIARLGLGVVEALESDNTPLHWTKEDMIQIRDTYRAKLKVLKRYKNP